MSDQPFSDPTRSSPEGSEEENPFDEFGAQFDDSSPFASDGDQGGAGLLPPGLNASLALRMAQNWISRHQESTMLGAFAVGVFLGQLLRD